MATKTWVSNQNYLTSVAFSDLTSHPSTLSGYGITDAKIQNGTITLGSNTITPLTSFTETDPTVPAWAKEPTKPSYSFSELTSHPTTLSGYGITDALGSGTTFWGQSASNGSVSGNIEAGSNGGYVSGFDHIELNTHGTISSYGGYIDFHFNGSSSDYTSRIIEDASGRLYLNADNGVRIGNAVLKWDSTNSALYIETASGGAASFYATGGVSALGLSGGSGGQIGFNLIPSASESYSIGSSAKGWKELCLAGDDESGRIYVTADGLTLNPSTGETIIIGDLSLSGDVYSRYINANRFYLDSTRYIYLDNGTLKYYNGTASKTIYTY